jgi:4-amino-4-deoxy-L-arabinose transferase-like glycosyltransferase
MSELTGARRHPAGGFSLGPRLGLALVAGVAFFVRLLHVLSYDPTPTNDMAVYVDIAVRRLALGNLFTMDGASWFPPGYPIFMKPFFLALAPQAALRAIQIAQAALGAWTCVLVGRIARRIHSRRTGLVAAVLSCFYPHFLFYSSAFMSETLFTALLYAALLLFMRAAERPGRWSLYRAGAAAAAATLVRPAAVSLAPAALYAAWRSSGKTRKRIEALSMILAGGLTLVAPWALRNTIAYGRFVLLAPNGAFNLAVGNHPGATGTYTDPPSIDSDLWGRMEHYRQQATGFIANDPWGALFVTLRLKWRSFWQHIPPWPLYSSNPNTFAGDLFFPMVSWRNVFFFGLAGAGALLMRRGARAWLTPACMMAYAGFYMIYFGNARLRFPCEGYFIAWAAVAVVTLSAYLPRPRRIRATAWSAAIGVALVLILAEAGWVAAGTGAFARSDESLLAIGEQFPVVTTRPPRSIFGESPIRLDRSKGRYLRMGFTVFRQGPHRDSPNNGLVQILYLDASGRTMHWLDNSTYYLEALPADRWVSVAFKSQIPTGAASCKVNFIPDETSPDTLIIDQPILRYARGNDLAFEFLYPYLRYSE